MKPIKIALFLFSVFLFLGLISLFFPKSGVEIGALKFSFPSFESLSQREKTAKINVDSLLFSSQQNLKFSSSSVIDSLKFFKNFLEKNPNRIHLPDGDFRFFDDFFFACENAENRLVRVLHYGDSQIEMDRITGVLRRDLQAQFSGGGVGLLPAVQSVPSPSVRQSATGDLTRFLVFSNNSEQRAPHARYGVLGQFSQLSGQANLAFSVLGNSQIPVRKFSRVKLIFGNNNESFSAKISAGDFSQTFRKRVADQSAEMVDFRLPTAMKSAEIALSGEAEIYALSLDDNAGVAVDNVPMRGCSGTIFTKIDENNLVQIFKFLEVKFLILQFGGNRMPSINSLKNISAYMRQIERQIAYFRALLPSGTVMFIGPSDMTQRYDGELRTWKFLPELNDSLKATALRSGAAYWDMFRAMGGEDSMARWVEHSPPLASSDYIHFTQKGAYEIGTILSQTLLKYYEFYKLRQTIPADSVQNFMAKKR